jgi:hypothetical protein
MGEAMTGERLAFVSFEPQGAGFEAFALLGDTPPDMGNLEQTLREAAVVYSKTVAAVRASLESIAAFRARRQHVPAWVVWHVGDDVFALQRKLEGRSMQINGLYEHLMRDTGVKRQWLKKVVIFRRYVPEVSMIPKSLNWGRCSHAPGRAATELVRRSRARQGR